MRILVLVIILQISGVTLYGCNVKMSNRGTMLSKRIVNEKDGAEMVLIPAGEFQMGSPKNDDKHWERPIHTVYLDEFYMDVHPVTNAQYQKFVRETGYPAPKTTPPFSHPQQPVVWVHGGMPWNMHDGPARHFHRRRSGKRPHAGDSAARLTRGVTSSRTRHSRATIQSSESRCRCAVFHRTAMGCTICRERCGSCAWMSGRRISIREAHERTLWRVGLCHQPPISNRLRAFVLLAADPGIIEPNTDWKYSIAPIAR